MDIFAPLQNLADTISYDLFRLSPSSHLGQSLNFFLYDTVKIIILLIVINYLMAIVRHFLPVNRIKDILATHRWFGLDYLLAAIFGVVTPFCSCSSIPLFIGFVSSGIPLGVTFAFLITSPLVNEASLALFPAMFGVKFTLIYNLAGVLVGVVGGMVIERLHLGKYIEPSLLKFKPQSFSGPTNQPKLSQLMRGWWSEAWEITRGLIPYILAGIAVGALIHGFIPANFFEKYLAGSNWWSVPVAALIGVPFYANSVGVIPIMESLIGKGIPIGTILAFMTATVTLSIPEALILRKAMKLPLLLTFFGVTTLGIILIGYLFNFLY